MCKTREVTKITKNCESCNLPMENVAYNKVFCGDCWKLRDAARKRKEYKKNIRNAYD